MPVGVELAHDPDDARIGNAQHWLKKAIKRYLRGPGGLEQVRAFDQYNYDRPHQSLDDSTPAEVHFAAMHHEC